MSKNSATVGVPRPTLQRKNRNVLVFLRDEWGLLLLAAALTVITWYVTRLDVESAETLLVSLELQTQEPYLALTTESNDLKLDFLCSESELEEARRQLRADGYIVKVFVQSKVEGFEALHATNVTFGFPFRASYLAPKQAEKITNTGYVYRLTRQTVVFAKPSFDATAAEELGISDVEFVGPSEDTLDVAADTMQGSVTPDPLTRADMETAIARGKVRLTFAAWSGAEQEHVRTYRKHIAQQFDVEVTLSVGNIEEREIQNVAVKLIQNAEFYDRFDIKLREDRGFNKLAPDLITHKIRAPKRLLDLLERNKDGWYWGIAIRGELPDEPASGEVTARVSANIKLVILDSQLRDERIQHMPPEDAVNFRIDVTRRKR